VSLNEKEALSKLRELKKESSEKYDFSVDDELDFDAKIADELINFEKNTSQHPGVTSISLLLLKRYQLLATQIKARNRYKYRQYLFAWKLLVVSGGGKYYTYYFLSYCYFFFFLKDLLKIF
jgi:hypothetical protein